eukprot:scaffold5146_cov134-Skeletonema_marinoi.AAC.15
MMCRPPRANTSRRRTGPVGGPSAATSPFKNLKWPYLEKYDSQHVGRTHAILARDSRMRCRCHRCCEHDGLHLRLLHYWPRGR